MLSTSNFNNIAGESRIIFPMLLIPDTHHTDITGITDILLNLRDTAVLL